MIFFLAISIINEYLNSIITIYIALLYYIVVIGWQLLLLAKDRIYFPSRFPFRHETEAFGRLEGVCKRRPLMFSHASAFRPRALKWHTEGIPPPLLNLTHTNRHTHTFVTHQAMMLLPNTPGLYIYIYIYNWFNGRQRHLLPRPD